MVTLSTGVQSPLRQQVHGVHTGITPWSSATVGPRANGGRERERKYVSDYPVSLVGFYICIY